MSNIKEDKKTGSVVAGQSSCSFEGKVVSIAGSRVEVESDEHKKTSYALATDAILTCDGKVCKEESLKVGKRVRITTQKGNSNMVTGIEWLNKNASFPAVKSSIAK